MSSKSVQYGVPVELVYRVREKRTIGSVLVR